MRIVFVLFVIFDIREMYFMRFYMFCLGDVVICMGVWEILFVFRRFWIIRESWYKCIVCINLIKCLYFCRVFLNIIYW